MLRRVTRELGREQGREPVPEAVCPRKRAMNGKSGVEELLKFAAQRSAARCRELEPDVSAAVKNLERGLWARKISRGARAAAQLRIMQATRSSCGCCGEELADAIRALKEAGGDEGLEKLDNIVAELCENEEAQIVLTCMQQAVRDSDRLAMELWLEQAENINIERLHLSEEPILLIVREYIEDFEEIQRRNLASHPAETREERFVRLCKEAVAAKDQDKLTDLISEAERSGLDVSKANQSLDELRVQMVTAERAKALYKEHGRGNSSLDWGDPSTWNNTEDFLNAFRQMRTERGDPQFAREATDQSCYSDFEDDYGQGPWWQEAKRREQDDRWGAGYGDDRTSQRKRPSARRETPPKPKGMGRDKALQHLGLPPGKVPSLAVLKASYKKAAMHAHPDRPQNRDRQAEATADFQQLRTAFDELSAEQD